MLGWLGTYEGILAAGLGLAIILNGYQIRALALSFITLFFLILSPRLINLPPHSADLYFTTSMAIELCFGLFALLTRANVGRYIAILCIYCATVHVLGWISYNADSPIYSSYQFLLRVGEISQVIALILSSKIITRLVLLEHLKCIEKDKSNGHRMAPSRG